jgi:hypothetical protein
VVKSRKHHILRVFLGNDERSELSILGTGEIEFKNGEKISSPFACYIKLDSLHSTADARISFMQVIAVRHNHYIMLFDCLTLIPNHQIGYSPHF